jgi:hypothetical protein
MDFTGKPMKSMIYVSAIGMDSDQALAAWIEPAVRLARNAPEKKSAPRSVREHRITPSGSAARGSAAWIIAYPKLPSRTADRAERAISLAAAKLIANESWGWLRAEFWKSESVPE